MFQYFRTKAKIIVNAVLLFFGLAFYGGFWFGSRNLLDVSSSIRSSLIQSDANEEKIAFIERFFSGKEAERLQIEGYALTDDDVVGFIEEIEALAQKAGVDATTDAVSKVAYPKIKSAKWEALSVSISTKGSWTSTYQFLSLLEHLPFRSALTQVIVEHSGEEKKEEYWRGVFNLIVLKKIHGSEIQ